MKIGNQFKFCVAIFHQMFTFSPNDSALKTIKKCFLFNLKNSFGSRDIRSIVIFFPSFSHFPDSKGQIEVE